MILNYAEVEQVAADLCRMSGGDWDKPRTKRNLWRRRALALAAMARHDMAEAKRVMRSGK